jgi:hypothetical protein
MRNEFEKHMRIAGDLLSYCHHKGATEFHLDIKESDGAVLFTVEASPAVLSDEALGKLQKKLSAPRRGAIEQEYWHLAGESEDFSELTLVGMMSDDADVKYDGAALTITLARHEANAEIRAPRYS